MSPHERRTPSEGKIPRDVQTPRDGKDRVVLRTPPEGGRSAEPELVVDDVPVPHGRLADGTYYLPENAYVWSDDLRELGEQLVQDRARGALPTTDPSREES
ncbi:hypothetical protein GA707_07485 [Nostocoides sp. F2B08]|uniref:hypothetical protein n=1 Tax=Nostocoides sp. F2B08 TaxID=2653936 RepID=UPI00126345DA|nr:hypothetical protein [Tetrasphaera sp. F2B08]KAB7744461.1 hypothetical protein GA707_07485 [Tetrasphaera sp. F2B08]